MSWRITTGAFALLIFAAVVARAQGSGVTSPPTANSTQPGSPPTQESSSQASSQKPSRIRVGGNVAAASLTHQVMPVYPVVAKQAHVSGTVVLHCIIGKDGSVQALEYVSGPPLLMKSAMDAVRQWTYQPTLLNGEAVEVDTTVSVVFALGGNTSNSTTDHKEPPPPPSAPAGQQERGAAKQSLPANSGAMPLEERVPESGSVTDNVYTNKFYGFTYEFPKGWSVPGEATKKYVAEMGKALSTGGDPTKKAMAEVAEKSMHQLLQAFEHPFGTPGQFNENIILVAQDVSYLPGIQKGSDYLLIVKAGITKIRPDLKVLREPTDVTFGGKIFSRMDVSFEPTIGITIYQAYVATIVNMQALGFTFTANKPERLATLVDTLNTLEFKPELARPSVATDAVSGLSAQSIPQLVMLTNSDGVDFQSYILTIWGAVKPKWYSVMPDSALHGAKGKVVLVFGIRKDGSISSGPKAEVSSGNAQLDEAAIAAIHLTAPFSPFPAKFKGKEIRLRIIFLYNIPAETVLNTSPVRNPPASTTIRNTFAPAILPPTTPEAAGFFKQGDESYKRKDWANAEAAFDSATKSEPDYALAWRELGRSRMELRKYADAETAFRKYLELAPNDPYAYSSVVWTLNAQRKYDDSIELLKKRLASNPTDAPAQQQLGGMYLVKRQPDLALPELQKGITLNPNVSAAHHMLAQAYVQLKDFDKAAASYERAVDLDSSPLVLNNVAFELSVANTHLDLADTWSTRAVHAAELELNQARLPFQSQIMFYTNQIAAFWDTLGWIKFQKHDLAAAQKYLFASAQLASDPTVTSHLGRVYEARNQTDDAIEAYAEALALKSSTRGMSDDEKEAQRSLTSFLGGDALIESRVKAARAAMADRRTVSMPNSGALIGVSEYMLIVGPGSKLADVMPFTSDDPLATMTSMVRAAIVPQSFPDDVIQKLPRMGTLSCPSADRPCTLTLMPAVAASRVVAPSPPTPGEQ